MKRFLITSGILLGLALTFVVALFIYLSMTLPPTSEIDAKRDSVNESATTTGEGATDDVSNSSTTDVIELSEDQKEQIRERGIDPDKFEITEAMVACVKDKVGQERINELIAGAEPTLLELGIAGLCANAE